MPLLIPSFAHSHWIPAAIFCLTYLFIAIESSRGSHLDRTAAAFCGAVAMVLAGALTLGDAYKAIDWNTLIFLLGMMIIVAHFQVSGVFDWIAIHVSAVARTRLQLLVILVLTSGILAAFFVNDTICLIFTPIVLAVTHRLKVPPIPYLMALATSANIGSVMSVTGNPQNALVGISAHLSFLTFLFHLAPVALIGLALDAAVLALFSAATCCASRSNAIRPHRPSPSIVRCSQSACWRLCWWLRCGSQGTRFRSSPFQWARLSWSSAA